MNKGAAEVSKCASISFVRLDVELTYLYSKNIPIYHC